MQKFKKAKIQKCKNALEKNEIAPNLKFQVRITVFDDGSEGKSLPTGFNADVEGNYFNIGYFLHDIFGNGFQVKTTRICEVLFDP